ncbi:MAG: hypothetical protein MJ124_07680 [Lachnospiraceae bacterium]|nr:hypothetical protein [Lachnospiraceae bacterium]
MGKIIAFYSPFRGTGTTTIMATTGAATARKEKTIVALTQLPGRPQNIEEFFDENIASAGSREIYSKSGLWALWQTFRQGRLTASDIRDCAVKTTIDTLDLFPYMPCGTTADKAKMAITALIMGDMKRVYDYCYIDIGDEINELSKSVIAGSDAVVCVLPQSERAWQKFIKQCPDIINTTKSLYLVNGVLKDSSATVNIFERLIHKETNGGRTMGISADPNIRDAASGGKINRLFTDQKKAVKKNEVPEFLRQIQKTEAAIMEACEVYGSC